MNTHENLEHAEHAEHHASDPFDKRVAVTMAIVAALLAGIAMLGHRTHNLVLQLQGDANRYSIEAADADVEKSNIFGWFQQKKARQTMYELAADQDEASDKPTLQQKAVILREKVKEYEQPDPKRHESLPELIERGNAAGAKAVELRKKAKDLSEEAEHVHHQADRLDVAHLLAEMGLVLCSVTILTKRKGWWYAGILSAVVALAAVGSAYAMSHHAHADSHEEPHHEAKPEKKPDAH